MSNEPTDNVSPEHGGAIDKPAVMRRLFILRPIEPSKEPWYPWYDKAFGFVVRAEGEEQARLLAHREGGDETPFRQDKGPWLDPEQSSCVELTGDGPSEVVIRDFAAA